MRYATASATSAFTCDIRADASEDDIKALVAQSQKRSAVFDIITNPTNVFGHRQIERRAKRARRIVRHVTTVIIGAGQSGLAMSKHLH